MCPIDDEADRAAILARRQRFIAVALSSLAAAATSCERAGPRPCLDIATPEDVQRAREREAAEQGAADPNPDPNPDPNAEPAAEPDADANADPNGESAPQ